MRHKKFPTAPRTWHLPGAASSASPPGSQGSRDLAVQTRGHHTDTLPSDTRREKMILLYTPIWEPLTYLKTESLKDTPQGPYLTPSFLTTKAVDWWKLPQASPASFHPTFLPASTAATWPPPAGTYAIHSTWNLPSSCGSIQCT